MTSAILIVVFVASTGVTTTNIEYPKMSSCEAAGKQIVQEITQQANDHRKSMTVYYTCTH